MRQYAAQVFAVHVLHREEVLAALLADVVNLDDVLMVELRGETCLVEEHLHERGVVCLTGTNALDDDVPREAFDATGTRKQHLRHATARQVLDDLIAAELRAYDGSPHATDKRDLSSPGASSSARPRSDVG